MSDDASNSSSASASSPADWTQFHRDNMQRWNPYETVLGVGNVGSLQLKWKNKVGTQPGNGSFAMWISDKEIMLAKYYRKKGTEDTLVSWKDDTGQVFNKLKSEIRKESGSAICDKLIDDIKTSAIDGRTRVVTNNQVEWFLIAGDTIIDRGDWAGKYIPI